MLEGLYLLVGHLLGDFILQEDWQASNKTNKCPECPSWVHSYLHRPTDEHEQPWGDAIIQDAARYLQAYRQWWIGHLACTVHCTLYTLVVWAMSFWWMPWWGLGFIWVTHFAVDRPRLARRLMQFRHEAFATGVFSPWSIIVFDQCLHLMVLCYVGFMAGR